MNELQVNFPTKESLAELHNDINLALGKFRAANPDVQGGIICGSAFNVMLNFAYTWMGHAKTQNKFVQFVTKEAEHFIALMLMAKDNLISNLTD